jgi:hypothetical protein
MTNILLFSSCKVKAAKRQFELKPGDFVSISEKGLEGKHQDIFDSPVVGQIQYMWAKKGQLSGHVQLF